MKNQSKIRNPKSKILFLLLATFFVLPSTSKAGSDSTAKLTIYTVNYPLKYFAERIAGEHAKVIFPAPVDMDPAYWIPDINSIIAFQKADLILLNGAGYAKWVDKATLPRSKMVDTSRKFKSRYITMEEAVTHSHGPGGEHAHESLAFTTWIDFDLAARQAGAIAKSLGRKRPELKSTFEKNYAELQKNLKKLDQGIKGLVANNRSQPLIASHPVYDYFARRYELNMKSVHWEPDEVPGAEQMIELQKIIKNHPAKWMIWEGEPMKESVERLKSLGVNSMVFDPCGNVPGKGDFMSVMKKNVESLRKVFP